MGRTSTLLGSLLLVAGVLALLAPLSLNEPYLPWAVGGAVCVVTGLGLLNWEDLDDFLKGLTGFAVFCLIVVMVIVMVIMVNDPDPMTVEGVVMAHESWTDENGDPVALFWMAHDDLGASDYLDDARVEALREHPYVFVGNRSDEAAVEKIGPGAFVRAAYTSTPSYSDCWAWTPVTPPSTTYRGEACVVNDLVMVIPGSASGDGSLAAVCEEANATACAVAHSESSAEAPGVAPLVAVATVLVVAAVHRARWNR